MSDDQKPPAAAGRTRTGIAVRPLAAGVSLGVFLGLLCFTAVFGTLSYFFMDHYTEAVTEQIESSFEESLDEVEGGGLFQSPFPSPSPTDLPGFPGTCTGDQLPFGPNGECYAPVPTPGPGP